MPPALGRLKQRREFLWVAAANRKWAAPGLVLQAREVDPARPPRRGKAESAKGEAEAPGIHVGFTTSRRVGNAVARNRARRRLRAVANQVLPDHAKEQLDYVIIGRRQTLKRSYPDLVGDLTTALKRVKAYRQGPDDKIPDDKITDDKFKDRV